MSKELIETFFSTPIYITEKPEWVSDTNKFCQPYIDESHLAHQNEVKRLGSDFGLVYHSTSIQDDPNLKYLTDWIGQTAHKVMTEWGADLSNHTLIYESMWVQEFPKDGGGHHRIHIHENCHVSGFYFLENDKASFPLFHDPRPGAAMMTLPEQNQGDVSFYSKCVNYQPEPGNFYMFPSYLPHEYVLSNGGNFRFIHFNITAMSNLLLNGEGSV
jgi:uncharacterized protein (TIGR02466 family)|tara:strand:+ start:147 stop:791 length:645 start_codon:yes stop_codon:yes gene_type:complete